MRYSLKKKSISISRSIHAHFKTIPVLELYGTHFPYKRFFLPELALSSFQIPNTMLGRQAEAIFENCIKESLYYKLITANIQIQGANNTLGELDYLLEEKTTGMQVHVELSCKFYLFDTNNHTSFEGKWIGPNRKDTLLDKVIKLREKQFPLLFHPDTKASLEALQFDPKKARQECYIATSLYIPKGYAVTLLPEAYQKCVVGYYEYFKNLVLDNGYSYAIPSKKEWLLPPQYITAWFSAADIHAKILEAIQHKKAPQIYKKNGTHIEKLFVVWWEES
ncbi:MAG: hypothetical protein ACJAYD_000307 [Patiriisocius sp.]